MPDRPVVNAQPAIPAGPLRRGDYIDPSGVRRSFSPSPGNASAPPKPANPPQGQPQDRKPAPPRPITPNVPQFRPSATGTGQPKGPAPLRDHFGNRGGNRTQGTAGAPPAGQAPQGRPGAPAQGVGSYTRPDRKFSPEELKKMMESGQIKSAASPTKPSGSPLAPARPGMPGTVGQRPPGAQGAGPLGSPGAPSAPPGGYPTPAEEEEERKKAGKGGSPSDRSARRDQRTIRQTTRVTSPVSVDAIIGGEDDESMHRRGRRPKAKSHQVVQQTRKEFAELQPPVNIRSLSEAIGVKANEIMTLLFKQGKAVRINDALPEQTAMELALEFGVELRIVHARTAEDDMLDVFIDQTEEGEKELRPPIITILGHVDHGKTSLLDRIRKSDVAAHESGGITQHIGAYQVSHNSHLITFLDTPGHEAFTSMRARGANVTDIVVLVVAADDVVMPQTLEAISHAKAAEVPIVVALNKIDLPNVNINRIFGELSQHGLVPEEYGGDTLVVKTSAQTGQGIPDLLENLLLIAELKDLKGNKNRPAVGTCLEAQVSEGRGVVATMLVEDGTLKVGDVLVCGNGYGRVRAMYNHRGEPVELAGPSTPVEVSGLDEVPVAGEKFAVLSDLSKAREIAGARKERSRELERSERSAVTLENLFDRMQEQRVRSLNIILKADVQGSLEALTKELEKLENAEIPIRILHRAVGGITESDVQLADASQAIIIGFRVAPEDRAISMADDKNIDIRRYDIIYQVTDEVKKAIEGMLVPEIKVVHLGRAAVRQVFKISKIGTVAGCFVTSGTIERTAKVRLVRDGREIYKGSLEALKRFKDDVREVREGFECGIRIANYDDVKVDDIIEAFKIEEIRRTL
ncbi:MAG: translation initiation factor IF-2 [Planctomycetota bacterium]